MGFIPLQANAKYRGSELTLINQQDGAIKGTVYDQEMTPIAGATVRLKDKNVGTITGNDGTFTIKASATDVLLISFMGYKTVEIPVRNQKTISVTLEEESRLVDEVVIVGYGVKLKEAIIGSVSNVNSEDLEKVHGTTTSATLAGKLPGIAFRMADGRPGATASIEIRNLGGTPLYVVDGIQQDAGAFNQLSPNDIENITILKDASAAIYGVRAANGVVLVTTKRGMEGRPKVSLNAYYGWQNWTRFPKGVDAYEWHLAAAEGEMNQSGTTSITPAELQKWKEGTEKGYQTFDWYDFVVKENAPQSSVNLNVSGGSNTVKYYFSATHLSQDAVFKHFNFSRTNIQSNIDAKVKDFSFALQINGRRETSKNPAISNTDGDDYWAPRLALTSNLPFDRPYANDNPLYPNEVNSNGFNYAVVDYDRSGYKRSEWHVLQTNLSAEYRASFLPGLKAKAMLSYYIADNMFDNFEYAYNVYKYNETTKEYEIGTGGVNQAVREKSNEKGYNTVSQIQLSYDRKFGGHTVGAIVVNERINNHATKIGISATPSNNILPNTYFPDLTNGYTTEGDYARIGYVGRLSYDFAKRYYAEVSARYDGSWKFPPSKRWGFFPSVSVGWRITEEPFYIKKLSNKVIHDLKVRASYGVLGDDAVGGYSAFGYVTGYDDKTSTTILDGEAVIGVRDSGEPVTNISWMKSYFLNVGLDFSLFGGDVTGSLDYFNRNRHGIAVEIRDVLVPPELGYTLPQINGNKDNHFGGEIALAYHKRTGDVKYSVGGNFSYSRRKYIDDLDKTFSNSLDYYRNSSQNRYTYVYWGYQVIGQFQSQDEINDYPVNVDGRGNRTILPGDFIYKDFNGDGYINGYDERPIGYQVGSFPLINGGLNLSASYKGFDLYADFSWGGLYSIDPYWQLKWPFQNGVGITKETQFDDRWRREDPFDLNSAWIPGSTPALRITAREHVDYNRNNDYFLKNVTYLRMKTLEFGYTFSPKIVTKLGVRKARIYVNTMNLLTFDNLDNMGIDPEITERNGLQYPQNKLVNVGVNLEF
jgi:TonB-linked SusC/RagA family outer membrane protein